MLFLKRGIGREERLFGSLAPHLKLGDWDVKNDPTLPIREPFRYVLPPRGCYYRVSVPGQAQLFSPMCQDSQDLHLPYNYVWTENDYVISTGKRWLKLTITLGELIK